AIGREINNYLCDKYILRRVSSTIKIASDCLYQKPANNCIDETITACLFGGIDYSADSSANIIWEYLPGTLSEIDAINENFVNKNIPVSLFKGKQATESNFMNIFIDEKTSPEILHIATHGFFYPDPELHANKEKTKVTDDAGKVFFRGSYSGFGLWQFVKNKNPLMRSGLVLAGANKIWNRKYAGEGEDGVLTALEVSQMNLLKTDLVVLSACETGLGDIRGSEGVYGLQRAFKMAGVKYIIMSLWQVPDKETVEFMETFYKKLLKEKDVRQAFNETQKEMRKKYDPYFWGAFVLIE
ncbi:MAG: CHAT domain-containing protein, partial [Bacteroidota bacterium]